MAYQKNKKPYLIGISGGSGAGKTFFLKSFLSHFNPDEICLISQDDYYFPKKILTDEENKLYNFDIPSSFDENLFTNDLQKILGGEIVYKQEYNFSNEVVNSLRTLEIKPAPIVIVEGLFVFHFVEIAKLIDMKIFIEADQDLALQRRIKRDREERGYGLDNVMYKWINHILPAYQSYILPHKATADRIVVNNTQIPEDIFLITEEISQDLKQNIFGI